MSAAPYELLRSGAVMVTGSEDIFRELAISKTIPMVEKPSLGNGLQKKVWELLSEEGCDVDRLAKRSGESVDALMAELTMMELEGVVKRIGDEYWV
jgi:predicted Rossmann fold nucleotide-binding protein DprA/Smf involved in DNA uptake